MSAKWMPWAVALAAVGGVSWSLGVATTRAVPTSVAIIDPNRLLESLDEQQVQEAKLKAEVARLDQQLQPMRDALSALQEEMKALEGAALRQATVSGRSMQAQLQATAEGYDALLADERSRLLRDMYAKIELAVKAYAEQSGFDIVLVDDRELSFPKVSPAPNQSLQLSNTMYYNAGVDITDEVIAAMNLSFKTSGSSAGVGGSGAGGPGAGGQGTGNR